MQPAGVGTLADEAQGIIVGFSTLPGDKVKIIILQRPRKLSVILHWACEAGEKWYPPTAEALGDQQMGTV